MAGNPRVQIGILALQGAVEPQVRHLERAGAQAVRVRTSAHLIGLSGIVLPGGESTAMIHLLHVNDLWEPLRDFVLTKPSWGVCAGAILLAKTVANPHQPSLGIIDIAIGRNAYGRQIDSFSAPLSPTGEWPPMEGVFIRAPRITSRGPGVKILFQYQGEPVMVEQGKCLVSTFHPELTESLAAHHYFITKCESEETPWMIASPNTCAS